MLLLYACTAPPSTPPATTIHNYTSSGGAQALELHTLFDRQIETGWQVPPSWARGEGLEVEFDTVFIDTLQFLWQKKEPWQPVRSIEVFVNQESIGSFSANQLIPVEQYSYQISVAITAAAGDYSICEENEQSPLCLQKADNLRPIMLSEMRAWQNGHLIEWSIASFNLLSAKAPLITQPLEDLTKAYIGNTTAKGEKGLALHPDGTFAWHQWPQTVFGTWQLLAQKPAFSSIALQGMTLTGELWSDTIEVHQQQLKGAVIGDIQRHLADSAFVNIKYLEDFAFDMRYATDNNFMKQKVYDCDECWLRYEAALALVKAQQALAEKGYRLKLFDCYRPLHIQKKLWKVFPNPTYVANPYKGVGSIHNRGGAVDITIIDSLGMPLDMGTPFDFFGPKAHQDFFELPDTVLANRKLLRETIQAVGFLPIRTEWWHYSYKNKTKFTVADVPIVCEE